MLLLNALFEKKEFKLKDKWYTDDFAYSLDDIVNIVKNLFKKVEIKKIKYGNKKKDNK